MNSDYEMSPDYKKKKEKILASNRKNDDKAKEFVKIGIKEAKKNRTRNAFDAFEVAKNLNPKLYSAWLYLGNLQEHYGFTIEAEISYAKAASLPDDKHNNEGAKNKYLELRMKETVRQAEVTMKETKLIPETESPPRAKPNISREDGLSSYKRKLGMSIEEREKLNERHEFSAIVFDEIFGSKAGKSGREMIVLMNEEKWNKHVQELISRGRRDVAAEMMVYCLKANPKNIKNWELFIDLLKEINDPNMMEAAEKGHQSVSNGEPVEKQIWRRLYVEDPSAEKAKPSVEKEYKKKVVAAEKLVKSKRFKEAESILLEAIALAPDKYEANYVLGMAYMNIQKYDEAEPYLFKTFEVNPGSTNVGLVLAQLYGHNEEFEKSREVLSKLLEYPKYANESRVILSLVLTMMRKHEEALEQYRIASEYSSDNPQFLEGYGSSLMALKRFEEAESVLLKAQSIKASATGLTFLADVQVELEKKKDAEKNAKRALKLGDTDIANMVRLANILRKLKIVDEAEKIVSSIVMQNPEHIDAQLILAICYFEKKDYKKVRSISKKVLELDPEKHDAWRLYGGSLEMENSGTEVEIVEAFSKAVSLAPDDPEAMGDLGRYYSKIEKYDEAERILKKSYDMDPSAWRTVMYLSDLLLKLGRNDEARELARRTAQLNPHSADLEDIVSHVFVQSKQWDEAFESVKRTRKLDSKHEGAIVHLAETYLGLGKHKEAEKEIKKAIKLQKEEDGYSWVVLSRIQRAIGKEKDAEKSEKVALEIDARLKDIL